jgi:hypothetical protein
VNSLMEDKTMGRFASLATEVQQLPLNEQDEIADLLETLLHGDKVVDFKLSKEEIAVLEAMVANPGPVVANEDVQEFFAKAINT